MAVSVSRSVYHQPARKSSSWQQEHWMLWVKKEVAFVNWQPSFKRDKSLYLIELCRSTRLLWFNQFHHIIDHTLTMRLFPHFYFQIRFRSRHAELVATRSLCAIAQAESLRDKLTGLICVLAVRRTCYSVLIFCSIMALGADGSEIVVSNWLRGQRVKSMKFVDGLINKMHAMWMLTLPAGIYGCVKVCSASNQGQDHVVIWSKWQDRTDNVTVSKPKEKQINDETLIGGDEHVHR